MFDQVTYFWDLAAATVPERLTHGFFAVEEIVERDGMAWAMGSDGARDAAIRLRPGETTPVDVVARPDAGRSRGSPGDMAPGAPFGLPEVSFGVAEPVVRRHALAVGGRRFFVWSAAVAPNAHGAPAAPGIWEIEPDRRFHAMPAPTWDTFAKLRPRRVKDGYTRDATHLETEIGPVQVDGSRIWFGTTFYDGEGTSGVGAIGSFDTPLADRPSAGRRGLVVVGAPGRAGRGVGRSRPQHRRPRPERRARPLGPESGKTTRIPIEPAVAIIRRFAGKLSVGTKNGLVVVDGAKTVRVRVVPERGGGLTATAR